MEKHFVIRTYGFCELAQLYNPNVTKSSASRMLKRWIENAPELQEKLQLKKWSKTLTPIQVKIIVGWFDVPEMPIR